MSYLALARKYRPDDFENIVSQRHITETLKNAIRLGRISHAYLFCGPRGTGKTTTARVLAKSLNCEKGPTPTPCGECTVCIEVAKVSSPDVFEIDAASNRGIDDIRELRENVRYAPVGGRYKIYIIDEVHRLTREAFDALLKTLEEPPPHVIFMFATTDPQALPPTILSRTQRYDFKRIPISSLAEAVNSIAQKEGLTIEAEASLMIAKKADGSLRDALSLLDQLSSFSENKIDGEKAAEILGLVKTELLSEVSESIINGDTKTALEKLISFVQAGGDAQEFAEALTGYIRSLLLIKNGVTDREIVEFDRNQIDHASEIISEIDSVDILRFFTILADYKAAVKSGQDPIFSLESAIVKMSSMDRAVSIEKLLKNGVQVNTTSNPEKKNDKVRRFVDLSPNNGLNGSNRNNLKNNIPNGNNQPPIIPPEGTTSNGNSNDVMMKSTGAGDVNLKRLQDEWFEFSKYVSNTDKRLFVFIKISEPMNIENGTLTLKVNSPSKFQIGQMSKPDNKSALERMFEQYFGSKYIFKYVQGSTEDINNMNNSGGPNPEKLFNGSPGVKKLFDLLGGEFISQ